MKIKDLKIGDKLRPKPSNISVKIVEIDDTKVRVEDSKGIKLYLSEDMLEEYEKYQTLKSTGLTDIEKVLLSYLIDEKITDIERMKFREEIKLNIKIYARQIQELENIKEKL